MDVLLARRVGFVCFFSFLRSVLAVGVFDFYATAFRVASERGSVKASLYVLDVSGQVLREANTAAATLVVELDFLACQIDNELEECGRVSY